MHSSSFRSVLNRRQFVLAGLGAFAGLVGAGALNGTSAAPAGAQTTCSGSTASPRAARKANSSADLAAVRGVQTHVYPKPAIDPPGLEGLDYEVVAYLADPAATAQLTGRSFSTYVPLETRYMTTAVRVRGKLPEGYDRILLSELGAGGDRVASLPVTAKQSGQPVFDEATGETIIWGDTHWVPTRRGVYHSSVRFGVAKQPNTEPNWSEPIEGVSLKTDPYYGPHLVGTQSLAPVPPPPVPDPQIKVGKFALVDPAPEYLQGRQYRIDLVAGPLGDLVRDYGAADYRRGADIDFSEPVIIARLTFTDGKGPANGPIYLDLRESEPLPLTTEETLAQHGQGVGSGRNVYWGNPRKTRDIPVGGTVTFDVLVHQGNYQGNGFNTVPAGTGVRLIKTEQGVELVSAPEQHVQIDEGTERRVQQAQPEPFTEATNRQIDPGRLPLGEGSIVEPAPMPAEPASIGRDIGGLI